MDRKFDYAQKILLAVEYADAPRRMEGMPASYALFKRLSIPEVVRTVEQTQSSSVPPIGAAKFRNMLDQNMGYWEEKSSRRQALLRALCHRNRRGRRGRL